jgi:hypothetical protein
MQSLVHEGSLARELGITNSTPLGGQVFDSFSELQKCERIPSLSLTSTNTWALHRVFSSKPFFPRLFLRRRYDSYCFLASFSLRVRGRQAREGRVDRLTCFPRAFPFLVSIWTLLLALLNQIADNEQDTLVVSFATTCMHEWHVQW